MSIKDAIWIKKMIDKILKGAKMKNCFIHNKNGKYIYDFVFEDRERSSWKFRTTDDILDAKMFSEDEAKQIVNCLNISKTYRG